LLAECENWETKYEEDMEELVKHCVDDVKKPVVAGPVYKRIAKQPLC
jgi:hypothetical protein